MSESDIFPLICVDLSSEHFEGTGAASEAARMNMTLQMNIHRL